MSLPGRPDASTTQKLDALWAKIQAFGKHLRGLTFAQIHDQLVSLREADPRDRQAVRTCDSDSIGIGEHGGTVVERPGTGTAGSVVVGRDSVVVRAGLVVGR